MKAFTTPSRSSPGHVHELVVSEAGRVLSCTCKAWRYRRRCYHALRLAAFLREFRPRPAMSTQ